MKVTITGSNSLLRRAELDKLAAAFVAEYGDMAVERLDGEEASSDRMREALNSLPFLSARKLVILRDPSHQKAFAEAIDVVLADMSDATTDVIFYEPKLDKRLSYYKTLKKQTDFREFGDLDSGALARWAVDFAAEQGGTLAPTDARFLIDRVGLNQQLLQQEILKLVAYDDHITRQTIELLTEPMPQSTIFELLEAAFAGKTDRAFALYREQRALKVEPQAIIALLGWQLHILAVIKAAGTRTADEIAKEAKINPYVVRKSQGIARRLTLARLRQLIADLLALDMQLKRSAIDADDGLQLFLLRLSKGA
jgi:DNA polymerase-3 subunit delta